MPIGPLRHLAAFALLATSFACRPSGEPSADYAECARLVNEALREKADEAWLDERAARALTLCERVPADSIDSEAAKALATRIRSGRAELEAERERLRQAGVVQREPEAPSPASPAPRPRAVAAPEVGSPAEDFEQRYAGCVKVETPFIERGGTRTGNAWALVDSAECAEKHPELAGKLVFVLDGKIFNVAPREAVERVEVVKSDAGYQLAPDAGAADAGSIQQ